MALVSAGVKLVKGPVGSGTGDGEFTHNAAALSHRAKSMFKLGVVHAKKSASVGAGLATVKTPSTGAASV